MKITKEVKVQKGQKGKACCLVHSQTLELEDEIDMRRALLERDNHLLAINDQIRQLTEKRDLIQQERDAIAAALAEM